MVPRTTLSRVDFQSSMMMWSMVPRWCHKVLDWSGKALLIYGTVVLQINAQAPQYYNVIIDRFIMSLLSPFKLYCCKVNRINNCTQEGTRESHWSIHDLQSTKRLAESWMSQIMDTNMGFPCPFWSVVIDNFHPRLCFQYIIRF